MRRIATNNSHKMPFGLAEGHHWKALIAGCATILLALLILQIPAARRVGACYFSTLSRFATKMGIDPTDVYRDAVKIDLIRILFGALVSYRYIPQLQYALAAGTPEQVAVASLSLLLAGCLVIGFAVPLASLALGILINPVIDTYLANPGIGSLVISMMALALVVLPAGTTLSVDAKLLQRPWGAATRALYAAWGSPSIERARVARLLPLLAYASISFCSAFQHSHEPEWQSGDMVGLLLMLPLMNPGSHAAFSWAAEHAPRLYSALSDIATGGMLAWQVLMIPLLLINRYTRILCIVWGIPFFLASQHMLNIKMLGVFEYVLWGLIFINVPGRADRQTVTVFFDDRCNLCDRTVRTISFVDVFRLIEFAPLSKNIERMRTHGVTEDDAQKDLVGVFAGHWNRSGYDLYLAITARVALLLPLWPVLKLGAISGIGPAIYRYVADRRRRLWGVCEMPKYRKRSASLPHLPEGSGLGIAPAIAIAFSVLLAAFVIAIPSETGWVKEGPAARTVAHVLGRAHLIFGMSRIDVFNKYDLEVYKHYVPMQVKDQDGSMSPAVLIPNNETSRSRLTNVQRVIARQPVYCGGRLADEALNLLPRNHPYRTKTMHADFYAVAIPGSKAPRDEVSGNLRLVCSVDAHFDASGNAVAQTTLSDFGTQLVRKAYFDSERVTGPWLDSVQSFPCTMESQRVAYWLRTSAAGVPESELVALWDFTRSSKNFEPMACLRFHAYTMKAAPSYAATESLPSGADSCRIESGIATAMASTALTADQRESAALATEASRRGDFDACSRYSASVRRAYLQRVIGDLPLGAFH
ncbi:hypothetical protein PPGU19_026280 [Paraburkholderia sp. PGU19]|uniref:thiol-disulfide oxidoreductase DCC family protein n=1 Tax=Paraburkholderia sp. PGU19 TaxID=2735434 RepID=UPI0015DB6ECA|nr:DUF393 domain-containing protein [Paraburkholderia sp. PGU19]BCF98059.1 hypothetical protein PPGU19_026280 [Paraburkholderia sp. PGU19]